MNEKQRSLYLTNEATAKKIFSLCILLIVMLCFTACAYETKEEAAIRLGKKELSSDATNQPVNQSTIQAAGKLTSVQFYVPSMKNNQIDVIDVVSSQVVKKIPLSGTPTFVIFSNTKREAYVSQQDQSTIAIINTQTLQVTHEIEVGPLPHGLALSADNNTLYIATLGDQFIYTLDTQAAKEGKLKRATASIDLGDRAKSNYILYQDSKLWVSDHENHRIYVVDTKSNQLLQTIKTSKTPRAMSFNSDGSRLYVPCAGDNTLEVFDTNSGERLYAVNTANAPTDVVINDDETLAWVTALDGNAVSVVDLNQRKVIHTIENLPGAKHIAFNRMQTKVYVTLSSSNKVAVIDTATREIIDQIEVGEMPHGIQIKALPGIGGSCG